LGDMGEVGDRGPEFHTEVGARAASLDRVWTVGPLCADAARAAGAVARHFDSVEALIAALASAPPAAAALVKGSRFMQMERVVRALAATDEGASHAA
ncbi:MAG: UDP-N-acetylmuramoylalanyl-D-glutamyl-2, 6-diaminopimelate--D-alanyl-D-alanine ligase, partial [Rubrivivax sp.]|nr:UDP-N-acetylmuramoylalanyl-D-glutamyl-2, 6-diaminopimelate--D-alanyl-D-alanine ligase [Rubrivivax sp.]